MVLSDFTGAIVRRWYVVLVGLLATAALAFGAMSASAPVYKARGLVVLMPSQESVGPGGNPFLGLGGLELPARVVVAYYSSESVQKQVAEVAPEATATVSMEESTRGPVIAIDVEGPSGAVTIGALDFIAQSIPTALDRLQQEVGAPKNTNVRALPLVMDEQAMPDTSAALRLTILTVGLGLVGTGFLAFAIDGIIRRRKDLKRSGPHAVAAHPGAAHPVAPHPVAPHPVAPHPVVAHPGASSAAATRRARAARSGGSPQPAEHGADGHRPEDGQRPDPDGTEMAEVAELRDAAEHRPARAEKAARKRG